MGPRTVLLVSAAVSSAVSVVAVLLVLLAGQHVVVVLLQRLGDTNRAKERVQSVHRHVAKVRMNH
jgi:sirohydrochlorin ferrochelatase